MSYVFVSSYGLRNVKERQESDFVPLTVERREYFICPFLLHYHTLRSKCFYFLIYLILRYYFLLLYNINT